jgi:hypothetical protein
MTFETEFKKRVRYQIPVERKMIDAIVIRCVIQSKLPNWIGIKDRGFGARLSIWGNKWIGKPCGTHV